VKRLIASIFCVALVSGCATTPPPEKTSLQLQAYQAKNFEADKPVVFKSVMSILQDLSYVIASASMETGFITAESPIKQDTSAGAIFAAVLGGIRTEGKTVVTASIEDFGKDTTRVRLNFVVKSKQSARYGQTAQDEFPVTDPAVYQRAFDKIDEAVFIRKGTK
jgi:hypothetical protein